jgi:predicted N-formylglutamate amidohydrolase
MNSLDASDKPPFIVENSGARSPFLFIGDHAGVAIPEALGDLGLPAEELQRHIAVDIGVAGMGSILAGALDASFIRQTYSRLVIDCNRGPGWDDSIPPISDGTVVAANQSLSPSEADARRSLIFQPYHDAIAAALDARAAAGLATTLISLHSFTPVMRSIPRPWIYGVLHEGRSPFSLAVLTKLRARFGEAIIGDNRPYSLSPKTDFSVPFHALSRGLDYLEIEVRQDLITEPEGQAEAAAVLGQVLPAAVWAALAGTKARRAPPAEPAPTPPQPRLAPLAP